METTQYDKLARQVVEEIGYEFSDPGLLRQALTHRSFIHEHPEAGADNERLEFLGDALLGAAVAEALMELLPQASEGELTARRAALVKEASLARLARQVGLGQALRLGRGEELNNGRERPSTLADAVEAVIGAVYLDKGYDQVRRFILCWLGESLAEVLARAPEKGAKTILQELLQAQGRPPPVYQVVTEHGPDHDKLFVVQIQAGAERIAEGRGRSKKEAETEAARQALGELEEK